MKAKYDNIPVDQQNPLQKQLLSFNFWKAVHQILSYKIWDLNAAALPRMATKLQESIEGLDSNLKVLNEAYAAGAVEGFDDEILVPKIISGNDLYDAYLYYT